MKVRFADSAAPQQNDTMQAQAYWITGAGRGELRGEALEPVADGLAVVRTLRTGISLGTERLIHAGGVPEEVKSLMRAPFQTGEFPWPVKYGYLNVGEVEQGPEQMLGRRVFCLYPHQDRYVVPVEALTLVPDGVPTDRAVLAGTVETAVNIVWEASPRFHDRVAVVGLGMVGASVALLLSQFPLARLQGVDADPARTALTGLAEVPLVTPRDAAGDCDIVVHCSGTEAGLATALSLAGDDAEVIEASWFGGNDPRVPLGADFHARRLQLRASQVGAIAVARRHRRNHSDRLEAALTALQDNRFDLLLGSGCAFEQLPEFLASLTSPTGQPHPDRPADQAGRCHVVRYHEGRQSCSA